MIIVVIVVIVVIIVTIVIITAWRPGSLPGRLPRGHEITLGHVIIYHITSYKTRSYNYMLDIYAYIVLYKTDIYIYIYVIIHL